MRAVVRAGITALVVGWWRVRRGEGWGRALDIRCWTLRVLEADPTLNENERCQYLDKGCGASVSALGRRGDIGDRTDPALLGSETLVNGALPSRYVFLLPVQVSIRTPGQSVLWCAPGPGFKVPCHNVPRGLLPENYNPALRPMASYKRPIFPGALAVPGCPSGS